ncbi:MAG TPA: hypothetical protein VG650_18440 [Mycobacteriales bacterium]|nr:hypothetical protein [Mycobacteriales bacterium]
MSARSRLSSAFDGLGAHTGIATALVVFALLGFLLIIQSKQDTLLWTGRHAVGSETNGLVSFAVHGQRYTFVPNPNTSDNRSRVDVYYDKADPFTARLDSTWSRALDAAFVGFPLLLAGGVLGLGAWRRARRRTVPARADDAFGTGLDPDFVRRQLDQLRRPR